MECQSPIMPYHKQNQQIRLNSVKNQQIQSTPFYTEIKVKTTEQDLHNYITGLRKQIKSVQWKQKLLLKYNYMPLQMIKQRIEFQKQSYKQKMAIFKKQYSMMFENEQFTQQLQNLRSFNLKLKEKMKSYQIKIQQIKTKNSIIKAEADQKRSRLKLIIKSNMELTKNYALKLGINNKQNILEIAKTKSLNKLQKITPFHLNQFNQTQPQRSSSNKNFKTSKYKSLFQECLDKTITDIMLMNTSSDIQQGIYLEIMNRRKIQFSNVGKISHRSTISNTLHERYAPKIHKINNKHFQESDFQIQWQIFRNLNQKQMLGIILIKDTNCQKLRNIFKRIQLNEFKQIV